MGVKEGLEKKKGNDGRMGKTSGTGMRRRRNEVNNEKLG